MIPRQAQKTLRRLAKGFPLVCITGPRQAGKTTLAKAAFPRKPYLSLEDPDIALLARSDPRGLLANYPRGLVLDEAQYAPELFVYLKTLIDANPVPGKYIVTGSQQFNLLGTITESLAGRAAFLNLLPFTISELQSAALLPSALPSDPYSLLLKGFYPPLYDRQVTPHDWYTAYITSYLERDIRSVINVKDLGAFQVFLKMCAARNGTLLNLSALALDCGISHNTAKSWVSILETSGVVFLLRPYYRNFGKRLVKSPKLYFTDSGLVCRILGINSRKNLFVHPDRGSLFESFIVSDILKARFNRGVSPDLYFWRDKSGVEVDLIIEEGSRLKSIEIKSAATFQPDFTAGLLRWRQWSGTAPEDCFVIYGGETAARYRDMRIVDWRHTEEVVSLTNV
jgi:predicted AAA+ superfamily ATPase